MKEMALADGDRDRHRAEHFLVFVYCALCQVAAGRRDWDNLADWSEAGDAIMRRVGHQVELSELLAWRAAAARRRGEGDKALRLRAVPARARSAANAAQPRLLRRAVSVPRVGRRPGGGAGGAPTAS